MSRVRCLVFAAWAFLALAGSLEAQVVRAFTSRFTTNDTGEIFLIGNTVLSCNSADANCAASRLGTGTALNDNDFTMAYVDVDSDATTFNSSRAVLTLPTGYTVLWAGLYWGGDSTAGSGGTAAPTAANRNLVRFATPASGYSTITASQVDVSNSSGSDYHAFANVTSLVQAAGNGTYAVANVQVGTGADRDGGWSLVVAFRAPSYPPRNLTVFDGFAVINSSTPNVSIPVSGFTTPPSGTVRTSLGAIAYEGDLGSTGDNFRLNGVNLSNSLNPATNFFNSSITDLATRITAKTPDYVNQLGFDIDRIDVSGQLANGATSATLSFTTGGETYYPGVLTFSTELFAPSISAAKSVTDVNGGSVAPGDILQYTVTVTNSGQDSATNVLLLDGLPANTTFVPGSLQVTAGANAGAKTDAAGDDQAELDAVNNRVVFRLGTGAGAAAGGILASAASTSIRFQVVVSPAAQDATLVSNQASLSYNAATLGTALTTTSNRVDSTVSGSASVAATKAASLAIDADSNGVPSPGDTLLYTVAIGNTGTAAALGVVFTDSPDVNTTLVAGSVTTTQGTVTQGNAGGDRAVAVTVGTVPAATTVTVTFRVTVNSPLPGGITTVSNQGQVTGANFTATGTDDPATQAATDPTVTQVSAAPRLLASKAATLFIDADGNGSPSPGDTLRYAITLSNTGNQSATAVVLNDTPDPNTPLVAGSVTTTQGAVTLGNGPGDTSVAVNAGTIAGGASVTVTFQVVIDNPLATGVTTVRNQASVNGGNFPVVLSNDPSTPAENDTTATAVTAAPALAATKAASLLVDADGDGVPSPGDTLLYQVVLRNSGNTAATGLVFTDSPDANTALVPGSVQASQGTVTAGNTPGSTTLAVSLGALSGGGGSATVSFRVLIVSPLPAGVNRVSNQGQLASNQLPVVRTDDPVTPAGDDATVTEVTARPVLSASKVASLITDNDGNSVPSPGDVLQYQVTVRNTGNSAATSVVFTDAPDANTPLATGSVSTDLGTVTQGNTPGDTTVRVSLGTVAGGGSAVISFRVTIANPLPAGVLRIANQGSVTSTQLPAVATDDPGTAAANDPTETAVTAAPALSAAKAASLVADNDGNGVPSPGDRLRYQITIANTGNSGATGVIFTDTPGANTTLATGSVQTSQGSVTLGNQPGELTVRVAAEAIAGGASLTITFDVTVRTPLPAGVSRVSNQGEVRSDQLPSLRTDDPTTLAAGDPTETPINAAPQLTATKTAGLSADNDGNGVPSPGDVLTYRIVIRNVGNGAATGVTLADVPDPNAPLIAGSVVTDHGTVTTGNIAGDTSVAVAVGTLNGGDAATIDFRVTIANPLAAGVQRIVNQGIVGSDQLPAVSTDDPSTPATGDATATAVTASPVLDADKTVSLTDGDGNGVPSPGDVLVYRVTLANTGNGGLTGVVFSDVLDPNAPLVTGSVQTSAGTVTAGNAAGDSSVLVAVGSISGGASVTISFQAQVVSPLPPGVSNVSNQGTAVSDQLPVVRTDDPAVPGETDPTVTAVTAAPHLIASKTALLAEDADGNGVPSPGDVLLYTVTLSNIGNGAATGAVITDVPDPNTQLIVGSVQADAVTIVRGNNPGDTFVEVLIGTIPGGVNGSGTFRVRIVNPLPPGVAMVSNQAVLSSNELPAVRTDDPTRPGPADPTVTPVTALPILRATKSATLLADGDGNGVPSPGDTLLYTIQWANVGNGAATGVVLTDIPSLNAPLLPGTVQTTLGAVIAGNNPGDTSVRVDVGTVPGATTGTVGFQVRIASPLPAGVSQVTNQATLNSNELAAVLSDDPAQPGTADPTVTQVTAAPVLTASKTATLLADFDGNGLPSPGETLVYSILVRNSGNGAATSVVFTDTPDASAPLTAGSVQTDTGVVTSGNSAGETTVAVNVGTIPGGTSAAISFRVQIVNPLPPGVAVLSNQGTVSSSQLPPVLTDDPTRPGTTDPTVTPVTSAPLLIMSKTATLAVDADGNGIPSPGDTLLYTAEAANLGNGAATGVVVTDIPDPNTQLIVGSVQAVGAVIVQGNNPGDTSVLVNVGTVPGGASGAGTFRVLILGPLPAGVTQVSNQATMASNELPTVLSDDPTRPGVADPTVTPVTAGPVLSASKAFSLLTDADGNGIPSPGDTLLYSVAVLNTGNGTATGVVFTDTPDINAPLVAGSVQTSTGTVTSGNAVGATTVAVSLGRLPAGTFAAIGFRVRIANPLPPGVTMVTNQGTLSSNELPSVPTDDPARPGTADPTSTPVTAGPVLSVSKIGALSVDADADGLPSPGDTLLYIIQVVNQGNGAATGVVFTDVPDVNTQLIAGSVQADAGVVVEGNSPGDTRVVVNAGTVPGGASGTGSFRVLIVSPLPAGVTQVVNQGQLTSNELPLVLSDDPTRPAAADPTITQVTAGPALSASKRVTLETDADANGGASSGDTLLYTLEVRNDGNAPATGVVLTDTPSPLTQIVAGSVLTTQGLVVTGNGAGATQIVVQLGTLPPGGVAGVSFRVRLVSPFPSDVTAVANQATITSNELPPVTTDDPTTLAANDATAIGVLPGSADPAEIPTLSEVALASLALLLLGAGMLMLRRRSLERI